MSEDLHQKNQKSSYRRGTIMGLTAAESFMLICFILLMLLMMWKITAERDLKQAEAFGAQFSEQEKRIALAYKDRLQEIEAIIADLERMKPIVENATSPEELEEALELHSRFGHLDPELMSERLRLLEEERLRILLEAVQELPEDALLELTDMASAGDLVERLKQVEDSAEMASLASEMSRELETYKDTGLSAEEILDMKTMMEGVADLRERLDRTGADVARKLREKAGDKIVALGGRILDDGDVIFPDRVLFEAGSARITPVFDSLLSGFCRPWFEVLFGEDRFLETVQIEGHASSEFGNLRERAAFDANLDLSQRRASAVFRRCLDYGGNDEVASWARSKMAAVGYSSARPVLRNGAEDREASRRVVFAIDMRSEEEVVSDALQREGIGGAFVEGDERERTTAGASSAIPGQDWYRERGYMPLAGSATTVRDGDTIEVNGVPIRLEGLHAPELGETLGEEARDYVKHLTNQADLSCWLSGESSFDREVGVCFIGEIDIAQRIIEAGLGADCVAISGGRYAGLHSDLPLGEQFLPDYCRSN